jgi:hypothetical protein
MESVGKGDLIVAPELPVIGADVSYDLVLWWFIKYDFKFQNDGLQYAPLRRQRSFLADEARLDEGPTPTLREIRKCVLRAGGKPLPPETVCWRYLNITRDMVARAHLVWRGQPIVPDLVQALKDTKNEEARRILASQLGTNVKSLAKIVSNAADVECGTGEGYRNLILCSAKGLKAAGRELPSSFATSDYVIFEGSHRLCGVWLKYADDDWPNALAGFVGVPPND